MGCGLSSGIDDKDVIGEKIAKLGPAKWPVNVRMLGGTSVSLIAPERASVYHLKHLLFRALQDMGPGAPAVARAAQIRLMRGREALQCGALLADTQGLENLTMVVSEAEERQNLPQEVYGADMFKGRYLEKARYGGGASARRAFRCLDLHRKEKWTFFCRFKSDPGREATALLAGGGLGIYLKRSKVHFEFYSGGESVSSRRRVPAGKWTSLAAVWDSSEGKCMYLDGRREDWSKWPFGPMMAPLAWVTLGDETGGSMGSCEMASVVFALEAWTPWQAWVAHNYSVAFTNEDKEEECDAGGPT
uniref:Uncharacterized protein n=1 Tax=Phaeomonas parva TaxID=124430 RepID=A0A7S1U3J2_9STRA|mmetsp:Transcript_29390/g.94357  ORF Transcript_29390/g.94357 Transcript_29390/m.94357 type:complete len:303 (+) Transcript_29390:235-1143(+)